MLRALASKPAQLVEARKRFFAQIKAHRILETAHLFEEMAAELKNLPNRQIAEMEEQIEQIVATDAALTETATILCSIPWNGPVASAMLTAEMPELGQSAGEHTAALTGLAPVAHDSEMKRGKRATGGGGVDFFRHVMFQVEFVA